MFRIRKNGKDILSVSDWFDVAPPKEREKQWKDGRSAKELARAWFPAPGDPMTPSELSDLLASNDETAGIEFELGEPELVTQFDKCGGEGRNADLVLWGKINNRKIMASIEAKADEPFASVAGEYADKCAEQNPNSRVPERFELLCHGLFGVDSKGDDVRGLRYQLLTAAAGTLCEADAFDADLALFIVHEFVGVTDDAKIEANAKDLNAFVRVLSLGEFDAIEPGQIVGPLSVPGNEHFAGTDSLFIGKCRRTILSEA